MQIEYERTGGFAGMRMAASFDLNQMPPEDAADIRALLEKAQFEDLPEKIESQPAVPDQFTYKITVQGEKGTHSVTSGEASASPGLRELIDLLTKLARERRTG
jgi:hypothetical protein